MFETDFSGYDADATIDFVASVRAVADAAEVAVLRAAAHFADLHGALDNPANAEGNGSRVLPGAERLVLLGGEGTPQVAEFAPAELGAALGISDTAAAVLIGDGLDLRHRLPRLWDRVTAGQVKAWVARKTAQATRGHDPQVAAVVDARVAPWAARLTWGRLEPIITAAITAADPDLAAAEAAQAAARVGVFRSRGVEHGIATTVLRTQATDAVVFDAAIDRIAVGFGLLGDDRAKDARRAAAVGVLANPQHTLDLYHRVATAAAADPAAANHAAAQDGGHTDADTPTLPADPVLDGPDPTERSVRRAGRGRRGVDPAPPVLLYVHLSDQALWSGRGVARVEDVGPVVLDQVKTWLTNSRVTVNPVLDPAEMAPVDAYEVPDRLREAVHLLNPADCFPYATNTTRHLDHDHTIPWTTVPDDNAPPGGTGPPAGTGPPGRHTDGDDPGAPGQPGQTRIGNLGKLTRRHHRIKTHGRWQVRQPFPGIWIWRSPHGRHYLVDHTGTTSLGKTDAA